MAFVSSIGGRQVQSVSARRNVCVRSSVGRVVVKAKTYQVEVELDGEKYTVPCDSEQTFLEAIEEHGLAVDSSCRAGVCMTCAAKLQSGKVDIGEAALADEVKNAGFVLTCSAYPRSDDIKLKMQEYDDAYDMQYGQYERIEQEEAAKKSKGLFGMFGK